MKQLTDLTLLDFEHKYNSDGQLGIVCPYIRFCECSLASPFGLAFISNPAADLSRGSRVFPLIMLEGMHHKLRRLKLGDWNLLRIKKLLPLYIALDTLCSPRDGVSSHHHWDWAILTEPGPFKSLRDLKEKLSNCQTVDHVKRLCGEVVHGHAGKRADDAGWDHRRPWERLDVGEFARWILDDNSLAQRICWAIRREGR